MELVDQRSDASWLRAEYAASERRVCGLLTMAVSSYRYVTVSGGDEELLAQLVELSREQPRFGYRRLHVLLRGGWPRAAGPLVGWENCKCRAPSSGVLRAARRTPLPQDDKAKPYSSNNVTCR